MLNSRSGKLVLLAVIVILGAFLRLYRIESLPPGETYDPAFYGLDALRILQGEMPIFFQTNFGREALYSYLVAACVAVVGVGPLAIHLTSAIVGILTVPAVYLAAEELFSDERELLRQLGGLVAALFTALSYWHLNWSRYGVRAILVPPFAAMVMYLLWRGMRTASRWTLVFCGVVLGLSMYTYQAAQLLPFLVLLGGVLVFVRRKPRSRTDLMRVALVLGVALVVFAPLGVYLAAHPGSSFERVRQVFVLGDREQDKLAALSRQVLDTVLVFSVHGDQKPTINLPGQPALNPFFSVVFVLGIVISLFRGKQPAYLVLLIWLCVMSIPGVLAQSGPTAKRIIGTLPAVSMLIAVGVLAPIGALRHRIAGREGRAWSRALLVALVILFAVGFVYSGVRTYRDYFVVWGQDPALFTHFEAGLTAIGQYVAGRPAEEKIYVSPVYVGHPSVLYNSRQRPGVKGYHGEFCMLYPIPSQETTYIIVPGEDERSLDLLKEHVSQGEIVDFGPLHYQHPYFVAYHVPADSHIQVTPDRPLVANWGGMIELLGYDLTPTFPRAGMDMDIVLHYRALEQMETDYTVFVQLLGPHNPATGGALWSQRDSEPCRRYRATSTWEVGEMLVDRFTLALSAEAPEAEYELIMGFYDWRTNVRLPVLDAGGQIVGDHIVLGHVHISGDE